MNTFQNLTPATIPSYAHPVPVGADGIKFRRVHGPRTQESTQRREQASAEYARVMNARTRRHIHTAAEYMAVTP